MKKLKLIPLVFAALIIPNYAFSAVDCGSLTVRGLTVQAERENGSKYANTMRILVDHGTCTGVKYAYLKNNQSAYDSTLSMLMALHAQNKNVRVWVKETTGIYLSLIHI